jgi:hypothetical protein
MGDLVFLLSLREPGYLSKEARGFAAPPRDGCAFVGSEETDLV